MKKLWITSILVVCYFITQAQFSISAKYGINSFPEWDEIVSSAALNPDEFIGNGIEFGFSYWFRLKNYRVEFMPEVSYQNLIPLNNGDQGIEFNKQSYFLTFNTLIYTLDIEGDCNCPTWGKDGSFLQKGFFVGVNPGIGYHAMTHTDGTSDPAPSETVNKFAFRIGVSTGLDIGITKWITITPYATLNYTPGLTWDNFENIVTGTKPGDIPTKITQIQPGLRLTFRPDYLKEQRGMFR